MVRDGLSDTLGMFGVVPDERVGEVMDSKGKRLCVEYENAPVSGSVKGLNLIFIVM